MRSHQKWWFLSEADEDQPGTDKDIDYYQHKSKTNEETEPPAYGWTTCKNSTDPAPTLEPSGLMVPEGEEYNTLEHQLAKWAVQNGVVELVLGDSVHREVVARSIPLIKFLASMCQRDQVGDDNATTDNGLLADDKLCLKLSHLLLAWKTCTSKADAAVSAEVYQLLVSILPALPNSLAIPLLSEIKKSLHESNEKKDCLFEVAEFCAALASMNDMDIDSRNSNYSNTVLPTLSNEVSTEALNLVWEILTHPDASTLKTYERLKSFVTNELKVEPLGRIHRENFLHSCMNTLKSTAHSITSSDNVVDEDLALRTVKLTQFLLEACPREHAIELVTAENSSLANLIFQELTRYLERFLENKINTAKRIISDNNATSPLSERLYILRYIYGLSDKFDITTEQLDILWKLCTQPSERESLMMFLAYSNNEVSVGGGPTLPDETLLTQKAQSNSLSHSKQPLVAAYSDQTRLYAFQHLCCVSDLDWEQLGDVAYISFQVLFKSFRWSSQAILSTYNFALDALWHICLHAGSDVVATKAMFDLLAVYTSVDLPVGQISYADTISKGSTEDKNQSKVTKDNSFSHRVFEYLVQIKTELESNKPLSERSAERCLRILNSAVRQSSVYGQVNSFSLPSNINANSSIVDIFKMVPHGMRGQSCYRIVKITARRVPSQHNNSSGVSSSATAKIPKLPSTDQFFIFVHPLETFRSMKKKIAQACKHPEHLVKPINVSGRQTNLVNRDIGNSNDASTVNLNSSNVFENSTIAELGITDGSEIVTILAHNHVSPNSVSPRGGTTNKPSNFNLGGVLATDHFFDTLLAVLQALPSNPASSSSNATELSTHDLVWDLLLAMPTNKLMIDRVLSAAHYLDQDSSERDSMLVETPRRDSEWSSLVNENCFYRSVYIAQAIDYLLQPAPELISNLSDALSSNLQDKMLAEAFSFRRGFIESGGFDAIFKFFTDSTSEKQARHRNRMKDAVCLRILKCSFFGSPPTSVRINDFPSAPENIDDIGKSLLQSTPDKKNLLETLASVITRDKGVSDPTILDVLELLRLLLFSHENVSETFGKLDKNISERFLTTLLLWERREIFSSASIESCKKVRRLTQDLILSIPALSKKSFLWLVNALVGVDVSSEGTDEFFTTLRKLVEGHAIGGASEELKSLASAVCAKLASHPRPVSGSDIASFSTSVLCGCLELLRALIEKAGGSVLTHCVDILVDSVGTIRWTKLNEKSKRGLIEMIKGSFRKEDSVLIDLMGAIFDGFLSSVGDSFATAMCCDKQSRQLGFDVVAAAARSTEDGKGYLALVTRLNDVIESASPSLRNRWSYNLTGDDAPRSQTNLSKYSGLRNQGCTCYMNSVLQQLFMMPSLRKMLCSATLPTSLRSSGSGTTAKGADLVGKSISVHWESGVSYNATVKHFDAKTGMHTIQYSSLVGRAPDEHHHHGNANHVGHQHNPRQQIGNEDIASVPDELDDEFFLSEGRPGKETGVFDVITPDSCDSGNDERMASPGQSSGEKNSTSKSIEETDDQASSRRLLEEVQRTFVHLEECSRGRCFDPRSLVEASGCLKLEFDVWQQNDASEFAMKLLDRLEVPLKKWSPNSFNHLAKAFGLKQTKQKICKECGLKTNREENLMNIDCQIRGNADIHEALSSMCEVELMEGNNKVYCDNCKRNTDTILRTAISSLPDELILSLKRFDLDFNTFETVKLNSRCAFGHELNMKRYTLQGLEEMANVNSEENSSDGDVVMKSDDDADYEYRLAGVLVHAGVAQGGHYYSFIKDRSNKDNEDGAWYRFDDEDVTPFDPSSIEYECFGGKVKTEKKYIHGQVQTVESEQFANALMLFYEKVIPNNSGEEEEKSDQEMDEVDNSIAVTSGYDIFQPDVRRSNKAHGWHTLLFDAQFQSFFKGLVGLCISPSVVDNKTDAMDLSSPLSSPSSTQEESKSTWNIKVLQIALTYTFDVFLHTSESEYLSDWIQQLTTALKFDPSGSSWFVHQLAKKTGNVSSNWLRVFLIECPEELSRTAAMEIISTAISSCIRFSQEQGLLQGWIDSWKLQAEAHQRLQAGKRQHDSPMPTRLEDSYKMKENLADVDKSSVSSIGIIISNIVLLLEHAPRSWRYIPEICRFIRDLATIDPSNGGTSIRQALIESQVPARLICLALREKAPDVLRNAFPGSSLSHDIAESMIKNETPPSSHLLPLDGTAVGMGGGNGNSGVNATAPCPTDSINLLEALSCLIGVPGAKITELVCERAENSKGRQSLKLTEAAKEALSIIFHESKTSESGMSARDIENYMRKCGADSTMLSPQKISSILNKYHTTSSGDRGAIKKNLSLSGFLSYYLDTAQTTESQIRADLNTFGFRLDLSRRDGSHEGVEMVTRDVSSMSKGKDFLDIGFYATVGLSSFHIHSLACNSCEPLAESLLATAAYGKEMNKLLVDALKALCMAPTGWAGTEICNVCLMIFKVLVSIPDERQMDRIRILMQCREKYPPHVDIGVGLLVAAKEFSSTRLPQHYSVDFHYSVAVERYIGVVKELLKVHKVDEWMSKNRELWEWMDHWFRPESMSHQRSDLSGRRDGAVHPPSGPMNHYHPESEIGPVLNESESEDSRLDQVLVRHAGEQSANGIYAWSESFDNVGKYCHDGHWNGQTNTFSLFRCKLSDNTRRWYISIVPPNHLPGTTKDTDFYFAPATGEKNEVPPLSGWVTAKGQGVAPPPECSWRVEPNDDDENGERMWNNGPADNPGSDESPRGLGFL
eukprot:CAMPEP_0178974318 /NCGR_PEP_ID=MMETSP0789-20121207/22383_1 /TAXON_ID=3005 /ORGANISM="Rhizosolenia setigera, Strain CCMP 1694" /LENGTH=2735 /DNA_ID=CAMNT_0020662625 /DNA_START=1162 /DNA_END=9369 /DNA_ORIENTATION=-